MATPISINLDTMQDVGENVKAVKQGNLLIFVVDTTQEIGLSSTGKMMGLGSTGGFQPLPGGFKGNVYVGKKAR
jgi:hypothetical protein